MQTRRGYESEAKGMTVFAIELDLLARRVENGVDVRLAAVGQEVRSAVRATLDN